MPTELSKPPGNGVAPVPRVGLTRDEAARAMGVSVRLVDSLIADRSSKFPFARLGGRVVVLTRELQDWLRDRAADAQ